MKTLITIICILFTSIGYAQKPADLTTPLPKDSTGKVSFIDTIEVSEPALESFTEYVLTNHTNVKEVGSKTFSNGSFPIMNKTLGVPNQYGTMNYTLVTKVVDNKLIIKITNFKHKGMLMTTSLGVYNSEDFNIEDIEDKFNKKFKAQLIAEINKEVLKIYDLLNTLN